MTKTFKFASAAAIAALAFAPLASAQDAGWSIDGGLGYLDYDGADIVTAQGHLGYDFNDYFGVEGELATGLTEEDAGGIETSLNYNAAAFATVSTLRTNGWELFGRLGYGKAEVEGSAGGASAKVDVDGPAYGVGAKYFFNANQGLRVDLTQYDYEGEAFGADFDAEATSAQVGYLYKF
ncbi:outer membrane beta-barrel protein [Robiginitomaculum antarcticum]|uniref:outer membrane beta-barrel protein n=1 Tax=Robiginitomaculum antarcticum TaxID=437507 RepID=UPI000367B1E2|nr:outer membrane beta-barrel protein [Robiginitomaculum antarcticum]